MKPNKNIHIAIKQAAQKLLVKGCKDYLMRITLLDKNIVITTKCYDGDCEQTEHETWTPLKLAKTK